MFEVIAAHNADQARLARLFEVYAPRVEAYLTAKLGRYDWHHAPQLASRTWSHAAQDIHQCPTGAEDAYAWLLAIGAHVVVEHYQATRHRVQPANTATVRGRMLPPARTADDMAVARQAAHPAAGRPAAVPGKAA